MHPLCCQKQKKVVFFHSAGKPPFRRFFLFVLDLPKHLMYYIFSDFKVPEHFLLLLKTADMLVKPFERKPVTSELSMSLMTYFDCSMAVISLYTLNVP